MLTPQQAEVVGYSMYLAEEYAAVRQRGGSVKQAVSALVRRDTMLVLKMFGVWNECQAGYPVDLVVRAVRLTCEIEADLIDRMFGYQPVSLE